MLGLCDACIEVITRTMTNNSGRRKDGAAQAPPRSSAPPASDPATRRRMQRTPQRDTAAELALRRELFRRGLRYRVDAAPLTGVRRRVDLLFGRAKVAVFVDGCFWHSCTTHGTLPRANAEWWAAKFAATARRDRDTDRLLAEAGWTVIRIWEHESVWDAADRIVGVVREAH